MVSTVRPDSWARSSMRIGCSPGGAEAGSVSVVIAVLPVCDEGHMKCTCGGTLRVITLGVNEQEQVHDQHDPEEAIRRSDTKKRYEETRWARPLRSRASGPSRGSSGSSSGSAPSRCCAPRVRRPPRSVWLLEPLQRDVTPQEAGKPPFPAPGVPRESPVLPPFRAGLFRVGGRRSLDREPSLQAAVGNEPQH